MTPPRLIRTVAQFALVLAIAGGCRGDTARIDGVLIPPASDSSSLEGIEVRLVALSDSVLSSVADACARYARRDSALTEARFALTIGRSDASRARALDRFRVFDDSSAAIEASLLANLDSVYHAHTLAVAKADSVGAFRLTRIPPGRYALAAARRTTTVAEIWARQIVLRPRAQLRVDVDRPTDGVLVCAARVSR